MQEVQALTLSLLAPSRSSHPLAPLTPSLPRPLDPWSCGILHAAPCTTGSLLSVTQGLGFAGPEGLELKREQARDIHGLLLTYVTWHVGIPVLPKQRLSVKLLFCSQ